MDTNKDYLLKIIKQILLLLNKLLNGNSQNEEKINSIIEKFFAENLNTEYSFFINNNSTQIISFISERESNIDFIKDIADILYIKMSMEKDFILKKELAKKIAQLYFFYEQKSSVFSFDIKSKLSNLEAVINLD